jgi:hypothetical protein
VSEAIAWVNFEDYLEVEGRADRRHEFVGRRIYAMAGGSERHDLIAGLLYMRLAPNALAAGCRRSQRIGSFAPGSTPATTPT